MKILITTCGVGIGHASRDLALAHILETHDHEVVFASYGAGLHYIRKNKQKTYKLPSMGFQTKDGELKIEDTIKESKDIPFTFIKTMYKESRIIKHIKPDIVIADSDYSSPITARLLNIPCYIITNDLTFGFSQNTDARSIKYFEKSIKKFIIEITKGCKTILIPDIPETIEIPPELEKKTQYIGPLLHQNIDQLQTKQQLRNRHQQKQDDTIIVVTVGGSDYGKILIDNICQIAPQIKAEKIIIFTGLEIELDTITLPEKTDKVIIKQFTHNMIEWMKLSDLTITLAGHTTSMELLSIKKPNIMIPLKNHVEQERNIKNMTKYNLTQTTQINQPEQLLQTINNTLDNLDQIQVNQNEYQNFIKYNGNTNALKIIQSLK